MATSEHYRGNSLLDIQERWTLKQLYDAHDFLDLFERLQERESDRAREAAQQRQHR